MAATGCASPSKFWPKEPILVQYKKDHPAPNAAADADL
jgi:hypothetical protein